MFVGQAYPCHTLFLVPTPFKFQMEKAKADKELAEAMPALEKAKKAVESIKPADINELRGMRNATDTTRLVFDAVQILF